MMTNTAIPEIKTSNTVFHSTTPSTTLASNAASASDLSAIPFYQPHDDEIDMFHFARINHLPLLLKGPTGCGKTRFVEHAAEQINRPLYTISCHDDLSAADLIGRHLIDSSGTYWQDGPMTKAVREGGICYLDEIIEARKDTTVLLHSLTDHRRELYIERTGEVIKAHKDFMLIISYNPSYQSVLKGLKPSTRQRFVSLNFDYPSVDNEIEIITSETGIAPEKAKQLVAIATDLRRLTDIDIKAAASTRLLIYAAKMIQSGCPIHKAYQYCIVEPLTDEPETIKALNRVVHAYC